MIRHLLYNCCPLEEYDPTVWQDNVARLRRYRSVFTGRRLIIIRTGEKMASPEVVKNAFAMDAEYIELPNDPVLCEVAGFISVLQNLYTRSSEEIIFYAHTKGISHRGEDPRIYESIKRWRNRMYYECLRDPEKIDKIMSMYSACGCFLTDGHFCNLHFSGTFFWIKSRDLFQQNWRSIQQCRHGVESYLSDKFTRKDLFDLYSKLEGLDLYFDFVYWEKKRDAKNKAIILD